MSKKPDDEREDARLARRDLLKLGGLAGLAAGVGIASSTSSEAIAETAKGAKPPQYPIKDIVELSKLAVGEEFAFDYPDENSPSILMRLKTPAEGGIGPGESVVAFSQLCTHQGCPLTFKKGREMLLCGCHFSSFDPATAGRPIIGQASDRLPQIMLRLNNDMVQAIGVSGLIYGRQTNIR